MFGNIYKKNSLDKWLILLTASVLVAYPVARFVVVEVRSAYLVLLFLFSLVVLGFRFSQVKKIELSHIEKLLLSSFFLMFAVTLLSAIVLGGDGLEQKRVGAYLGFLLAIPVYLLFRLYMPSDRVIWSSIVVSCYVVVIRAWLEVHGYVDDLAWSSFGPGRANGTMHPIRFGDLVLLLGFLSLAGSLYIRDVKSWMRAVGVLAFFCGLYASLLSQSRGGWIAIPALLAIVLWPVFRDLQLKNKFVLVLAIIIGVTIMFNMPGLKTKQRIDQAVIDIDQYWQHGNSKTSIGSRFDMYETAYALFLQKPLFGVGVGNYRENSANYFESNKDRMSREVIIWDNPHNEILLQMATRGLVGLVVLVMLFLSGIIIFFTHLRQYDRDTLFYAVSGLMVLVAYMHFGMSIALFKHRDFILFFVIYILLFSAGVHKGAVLSEKTL